MNCTYTDYAVRSNVSSDELASIFLERKTETFDSYCPNIREYVPFDKNAADPRELIITKTPKSTIQPPSEVEPTSSNELTVVSVVLVVVGVLLFTFYAVSNLVKRNHYFSRQGDNARDTSVEPLSQTYVTSEEPSPSQTTSGESSGDMPYRRSNRTTAKKK
ncbi:hypothetical protein [Candidatus Ichthyocystis hellenicum]|uniref:hypothetical protein n=1 Tax=Candidatus Ichthyocystis hellenicum TaxID=1561003 RepID=UPI000B87136D|nr:hypothetical protein [Candidatus Ichthyocystis hellenicum]